MNKLLRYDTWDWNLACSTICSMLTLSEVMLTVLHAVLSSPTHNFIHHSASLSTITALSHHSTSLYSLLHSTDLWQGQVKHVKELWRLIMQLYWRLKTDNWTADPIFLDRAKQGRGTQDTLSTTPLALTLPFFGTMYSKQASRINYDGQKIYKEKFNVIRSNEGKYLVRNFVDGIMYKRHPIIMSRMCQGKPINNMNIRHQLKP